MCTNLTHDLFHFFWKKGVPVVITGLPVPEAGPRYFITNFPELKAMIENCNGVNKLGDICEILVKECFIDFRHSIDPNILWKVKVSKLEVIDTVDINHFLRIGPHKQPSKTYLTGFFIHSFTLYPCRTSVDSMEC